MQGCRSPEASGCMGTVLVVIREASVIRENRCETSGMQRMSSDEKIEHRESKAFC